MQILQSQDRARGGTTEVKEPKERTWKLSRTQLTLILLVIVGVVLLARYWAETHYMLS